MKWPLMRRRTHMRIYTQQGEAYRCEIQQARWDRDHTRTELQELIDSLAPRIDTWRDLPTGDLRISVVIDRRMMRSVQREGLLTAIRDSIMRRLLDMDRDHRGDMRQTPAQRLLGL